MFNHQQGSFIKYPLFYIYHLQADMTWTWARAGIFMILTSYERVVSRISVNVLSWNTNMIRRIRNGDDTWCDCISGGSFHSHELYSDETWSWSAQRLLWKWIMMMDRWGTLLPALQCTHIRAHTARLWVLGLSLDWTLNHFWRWADWIFEVI